MQKTALVTGGSRGIGAAICRRLAQDGWRVLVNCFQHETQAQALAAEIGGQALRADVGDPAACRQLFAAAGAVDLLVNNAGVALQAQLQDTTEAQWQRLFAIDVDAVFRCCKLALPHMLRAHAGCIVNISSMWGQTGASCEVAYSAAKGAVIAFTKALAKELGPSNIRVNCVAPGVIDTQMNALYSPETLTALAEETPLCRLGSTADVAAAVAFLAGPDARFITGQVLGVNGGFII